MSRFNGAAKQRCREDYRDAREVQEWFTE